MKFYDRKEELDVLKTIDSHASRGGMMTVIMGRRRVGKTLLGLKFCKNCIAINDKEKKLLIAELKMNSANLRIEKLKEKSQKFLHDYAGYAVEFTGLSLKDAENYLKHRKT